MVETIAVPNELFSDLLKVAEEMAAPAEFLFKGKPVVVVSKGVNFTSIYYEGKTEDDAFSVKNQDLKPRPAKKDRGYTTVKDRALRVEKTNVLAEEPDFIDALRENATIRVQLPQQSVDNFIGTYESLTGEKTDTDAANFSVVNEKSKWGVTLTVLMPKEVAALAPHYLNAFQYWSGNPDVWAITNNYFVYELFSIGFRLGSNHMGEGGSIALKP